MKTQVLQLDPHDDAISTRDKLGWSQTGRILLVWPSKSRVLTRRLDLVLLQRHSQRLGAQLALVTRDPEVRRNASQLSIPVFKNPKQAQIKRWRTARRSRWQEPEKRTNLAELGQLQQIAHPKTSRWLNYPLTRLFLFTTGVLAVIAIAAVLLPGARIELTPLLKTQSITLEVQASQEVEAFNLSGILPVRTIEIVVEGRDVIDATGYTQVPYQFAAGEAVFTNLTTENLTIPAGMVIATLAEQPVRFATIQAVELQAGPGATARVPIEALEAGPAGNLPAEALLAIEGPLGLVLIGSNPEPTQGGSLQGLPTPSQADRRALYNRLLSSLEQTALDEFSSRNPIGAPAGGNLALSHTPRFVQTIEERYIPADDEISETLELVLRLEYAFELVLEEDIMAFAKAVLDTNQPQGFFPLSGEIQVSHADQPEPGDDGIIRWTLTVERQIQAHPDTQGIVNLVLGLPLEDALQRLERNLALNAPPRLVIAPYWWPRLPYLPFRINVVLDAGL